MSHVHCQHRDPDRIPRFAGDHCCRCACGHYHNEPCGREGRTLTLEIGGPRDACRLWPSGRPRQHGETTDPSAPDAGEVRVGGSIGKGQQR